MTLCFSLSAAHSTHDPSSRLVQLSGPSFFLSFFIPHRPEDRQITQALKPCFLARQAGKSRKLTVQQIQHEHLRTAEQSCETGRSCHFQQRTFTFPTPELKKTSTPARKTSQPDIHRNTICGRKNSPSGACKKFFLPKYFFYKERVKNKTPWLPLPITEF